MSKSKELKSKYVGRFLEQRRDRGPLSIYKIVDIQYDRSTRKYEFVLNELWFSGSYANPNSRILINIEKTFISIEHSKKIGIKLCGKKWVKIMCRVAKEKIEEFQNELD